MENCSVSDLKHMVFDKNIKPYKFIDGNTEHIVSDWTELAIFFVRWLIEKGYLTEEKLPVPNHARRGKYFINSQERHEDIEKNAYWHKVGKFYVDTKYNAAAHIKNILSTLDFLGVTNQSFKISFRRF